MDKKQQEKVFKGLSSLLGEEEEPQLPKDIIDTIEDVALKEALHKKRMDGRGRPRKDQEHGSKTRGYTRMTTIVNVAKMEKLKEIAYLETLTIKEVMEAAMDLAIKAYEEKHGEIDTTKPHHKGNPNNLF